MNKTVEAIKAGNNVATEELFEVVNAYVLTTLSLRTPAPDHASIMSMQVNQFEKFHDDYKFSQQCQGYNNVMYMLKSDDLVSVNGEYNQKADTFYITCKLKNGMELLLTIVIYLKARLRSNRMGSMKQIYMKFRNFLMM